ncbi:MAG: ABC transporter ATP-binding protein [Epulopiscium sp.]|nr:ABC transporter ATP-binding protein [Candidatus Epulonipiscium sp.]
MGFLKKYIKKYWKMYMIAFLFLGLEAICDLLQPTIMSKIVDYGVGKQDMNYVLQKGGRMLLVTTLGGGAAVLRNIVSSTVSQSFGRDLRGDLYKKIQGFSFENINQFHDASLITRLTNDVNQVQNFAHGMMRIFVKAPILCIGSLVMAFLINPSMTFILAAVIPIVTLLIGINMKISYPFFIKIQKALDGLNGTMREYLAGIRVVKAFNRFDYEGDRFESASSQLTQISIKGMRVMAAFRPGVTFVVNIGIVLVLWVGGYQVNNGTMQVGQIIAFINYMLQILFSLMMLSRVFTMFIRAKASASRIGEVFAQENTLQAEKSPVRMNQMKGRVDFKDVTFSYGGQEPVLNHITLSCKPGETVAIIGSTGSGKSSLVHLIPRFYDVNQGSIQIDGVDVRKMDLKRLRDAISIVPQKSLLFTGTIAENIRWGKEQATMEEIEKAATIAQAHDFISSFPQGYDTVLGQSGVNLSGGQKQRIAIARGIVKKPSILILDDSTSAVDVVTEGKIREELKQYLKNTTCILIAQRITSVMGADRIVVLDKGSIVGMGIHSELMKECQIYQDIFYSQIGKEDMTHGFKTINPTTC